MLLSWFLVSSFALALKTFIRLGFFTQGRFFCLGLLGRYYTVSFNDCRCFCVWVCVYGLYCKFVPQCGTPWWICACFMFVFAWIAGVHDQSWFLVMVKNHPPQGNKANHTLRWGAKLQENNIKKHTLCQEIRIQTYWCCFHIAIPHQSHHQFQSLTIALCVARFVCKM